MANLDNARVITHRSLAGRITFSQAGIAVSRLIWPRFEIAWSNVDFISPTPKYERFEGRWRPSPRPRWLSADLDAAAWLVRKGLLSLAVVVSDRGELPRHVRVKPLLDAHDQPDGSRGIVELHLRTYKLDSTVSDLFDLLDEYARFDLVVWGE